MFIHLGNLKKLLKKGYKSSIAIGSICDGFVITQGTFILWVQYDKCPNDLKAIIAEYLGMIPSENEGVFTISEDKPFAQVKLACEYEQVLESTKTCKSETVKTRISIDTYGKDIDLYQNLDFYTIAGLDRSLLSLVDITKCDTDHGETIPNQLPYANNDNSKFFLENDACKLIILPVNLEENKQFQVIKACMEKVNFEEVNG